MLGASEDSEQNRHGETSNRVKFVGFTLLFPDVVPVVFRDGWCTFACFAPMGFGAIRMLTKNESVQRSFLVNNTYYLR